MPHGRRIAEFLLSIGALKLSPAAPFTWTSGIKSPLYCDNRMIYSFPEARSFVVKALADRVRSLHVPPDVIAGTATAAIGWAALVADRLELPFVYVRSSAKEHGTKKRIEGSVAPGAHVVLIEDLLSTAGSAVSSVEALREEGKAIVTDVVAIVSYGFAESLEKAAEARVALHPLCSMATILEAAVEQDRITEEQREEVDAFVKDPQNWGK